MVWALALAVDRPLIQHNCDQHRSRGQIQPLAHFRACLPFDVKRLWDEIDGQDWPEIWTMTLDRQVWDQLQN
jgi:hypothetical protein